MSSDEYRTESIDTSRSSEEALEHSEIDQLTDQLFPLSEVEREIADEHYDDFKAYFEMLVEIGKEELRPLKLNDCYTSERPGMYLEILPKVIFETVETDSGVEEIDFPKPIFRSTIDQGTIASVEHSSSSAQTLRSKLLNSWSQTEPRLFSEEECDSVIQSESFNSFMKTAEKGIFESLVQNKIADSFVFELKSLQGESSNVEASKESTLTMKGSFVCFEGNQKVIIKSISWHPVYKDVFIASTLRNDKFENKTMKSLQAPDDSCLFYVWSCKNQFVPKILLEYFDEIKLHKFSPTMPHIVAGGSLGGQLILWNIDEEILSGTYDNNDNLFSDDISIIHHSAVSNQEYNHTRGIADLVWIPNHIEVLIRGDIKSNTSDESYQIATCGSDGTLKFWDIRAAYQSKPGFSLSKMFRNLDGKWEPFHTVEILFEGDKKSISIIRFAFKESSTALKPEESSTDEDESQKRKIKFSTDFYAGCDDGRIFCGNFQLFRDDTGKFNSFPPKFYNSPHSGPITTITVSPFISEIFLSAGARTVAIWKQDIRATPIFSRDMHTYITSAKWSDSRPSLFMLGYQNGSIEMWDLLVNMYEPVSIHFVSTTSITAISTQTLTEEEHILAVGDSEGIVYTLSLPSSLWMPVDNELNIMLEFLKKEGTRVQSKLGDPGSSGKEAVSLEKTESDKQVDMLEEIFTDEQLKKNYSEYLELEQILLNYLDLPPNNVEKED